MPCFDKKLEASRDDFNLPGTPPLAIFCTLYLLVDIVCSTSDSSPHRISTDCFAYKAKGKRNSKLDV